MKRPTLKSLQDSALAASRMWAKSVLQPVLDVDPSIELLHAVNTLTEREARNAGKKRT